MVDVDEKGTLENLRTLPATARRVAGVRPIDFRKEGREHRWSRRDLDYLERRSVRKTKSGELSADLQGDGMACSAARPSPSD